MTSVNPPNQYFSGIIYNPLFWTDTSNSTLYLGRIGTPNSVATNTTFTGTLTTNGITNTGTISTTDLTVTNVIQGTALNANNVLSQNNNANATHYITYTDLSTNGYGMLQKHATLTFNPNTEEFTVDTINAQTYIECPTIRASTYMSSPQITADQLIGSPIIQATNYISAPTITSTTSISAPTITATTSITAPTITATSSMVTVTPADNDATTKVPTTLWVTNTPHTWLSSVTQTFNGITLFNAPNDTNSISIGGGLRNMTASNKYNVCIGNSLNASTTGDYNMAIGNGILPLTTSNTQNIGIGYRSLEKLTAGGGNVNTAIGFISGYSLTSGSWNSFFSTASGAGFSTGNNNFCMGFEAMASYNSPSTTFGTNVSRNLALGVGAIYAVSNSIVDNVAVGFRALGNPPNTANANYTGSQNTAIGSYAGYGLDGTSSNGNCFIGYNCGVVNGVASAFTTTAYNNITAINTGTITSPASNNVYIGNSSVTSNTLYGTLNVPTVVASSGIRVNNKYLITNNVILTANYTVPFPSNEIFSINVTADITITLTTIQAQHTGTKLIFRRTAGSTTANISFQASGGQSVFNQSNVGGTTAQILMPSGSYIVTLCALYQSSGSTFAWYQI